MDGAAAPKRRFMVDRPFCPGVARCCPGVARSLRGVARSLPGWRGAILGGVKQTTNRKHFVIKAFAIIEMG